MNQKPVMIFDWDGTLADSMELCVAEVRVAMETLQLAVPPEEILRACNGPTYEETVPLLGIPAEQAQTYMEVRRKHSLELCRKMNRLFPGVRDMLLHLKDRADLCIASNGGETYIRTCCSMFGLEGVFSRIEAFQRGRTKAQAVAEILRDTDPPFAVMIGDRLGDIHAGKANGLQTICCAYGYGSAEEWRRADQIARTVPELEKMLLNLIG